MQKLTKIAIQYWHVNSLYRWAKIMSQKLSVNNFGWIEDTSEFNEDFIKKAMMKKAMKMFSQSWCSLS